MATNPFSREFSSVQTRRLFLNPFSRVGNDDSGIFLALFKSLKKVEDRRYGDVLSVRS
jgi:hypothetical protein